MLSARHNDANIHLKHHRHLLNPADEAAVKSGSIDVFGGSMEKVQDETLGSGASGMSDLSALENETDDFGRKLIQRQRDAQRLSNIRHNRRAFKRARTNPRVAERLAREERDMDGEGEQDPQRTVRAVSGEGEQQVTAPRQWGRKARKQTDWMKKIREPSITSKSEDEGKADENVIYPRRTSSAFSGDDNPLLDWETVDRPLQSIENTPPSMRRRARLPTPSSMHHMNTTLKPGDESDDGEFNAASLLSSTPATRLPRKIDELTRREIENIERRGLTTRALDHIDDISPNATRRASRNSLREQALADGMDGEPASPSARPISAPAAAKVTSPSKIPRRPGSALGSNKENFPFSDGGQGYKSTRTTGLSDRTAHAVSTKSTTSQQTSQRPGHKRNDSMGLLRRLARVSSMSPSPARKDAVDSDKAKHDGNRPTSAGEETASRPTSRKVDFVSEVKKHAEDSGVDQGELGKIKPEEEHHGGQTERSLGAGSAQTPIPPPKRSRSKEVDHTSKTSADQNHHEPNHDHTNPPTRKSALDDLVYQAKYLDNTQQYGENTMASLEDIAHPNLDQTDPTITFDFDALKREQEKVEDEPHLTQEEKDRRQEDLAVEAMNRHLRAASSSIKDANRGLRRVENRIETQEERRARVSAEEALPGKPAPVHPTTTTATAIAKPHVYCTCASRPAHGAWYALYAELRACFYTYGTEPDAKYSWLTIRPTWLGLAVLLWITWYLSETTLCSYFCNPRFAVRQYHWPREDAPEFPFVIPTLVFRPVKFLWKPVCDMLAWFFGAAFHWMFGDSSSSSRPPSVTNARAEEAQRFARQMREAVASGRGWWDDDGVGSAGAAAGEWMASATTVGRRVAQSVVDVVDEAGSMWDDERVL